MKFDIVFCSYGAIGWLHDLGKWANLISHYLKAGGFFYIVDAHPSAMIFSNDQTGEISVKSPYSTGVNPLLFDEDGSYADPEAKLANKTEYGWNHPLGVIVNSLVNSGLKIEFLNEHYRVPWQMFRMLEKNETGWW